MHKKDDMRKILIVVMVVLGALLLAAGCSMKPGPQEGIEGEVMFAFDLSYPMSLGYEINKVHCILTHQDTGKVMEEDLDIEPGGGRATGVMEALRIGMWDLVVELYEGANLIGKGTAVVEIEAGATTRVEIHISLATGNLEIVVTWDTGFEVADLEPVNFVSPESAEPGEVIGERLGLEVTNSGTGEADSGSGYFFVGFYLSANEVWDGSDRLLLGGRESVDTPLAAGETVPVGIASAMSIPEDVVAGTYYLLAVVDETGLVTESDEGNNVHGNQIELLSGDFISGETIAYSEGELGNWIDITFTSNLSIQLVDADWDWTNANVWLDVDGTSMTTPENIGVDDYTFHFYDPPSTTPPPDTATPQIFGFYAMGFDSGDYFKFTMDLDNNPQTGGVPFTDDFYGGVVTLEFSDGTVVTTTYDTAYNSPSGAKATFVVNP